MKIKHTYQTLFRVSETGLELVGDFVTGQEAQEYAEAEGIDAFTIIETTVLEDGPERAAAVSPTLERDKGPVKNSRSKTKKK